MRAILSVFKKEMRENLRDRRALFSAFLFVPLMGPILFSVLTAIIVDRAVGEADELLRLPVIGAEHAPNLIRFLEENGAVPEKVDDENKARAAVRAGRENFVLVIGSRVGAQLQAGDPTPIEVICDTSNGKAQRHVSRARGLLEAYGRKISALRLLARGVDPAVVSPFDVRVVDVATPSGRGLIVLGTLTYYFLFSLLLGGLHLAIDVTAGERERGSLEPLLGLPVPRSLLVCGKIAATATFMLMALSLTLGALVISMRFLPLEKLGMASNFDVSVALKIGLLMIPMAVFGSALLFAVGSFTRTYREAQTWLGALLAIPTLPILFASIANVRPATSLMLIPSLSQHLISTELLRGDNVQLIHIVASVGSTLLLGACLFWLAVRLYSREKLLGA